MKNIVPVVALLVLILSFGCAGPTNTDRQTKHGILIGAGTGAILGQAIGKDTKGTLIGAAAGSIVGGLIGNRVGAYMDQQEQELRNAMAASNAAVIQRTNDVLVATFKSDVMFDLNSAVLKPGSIAEISRVANVLTKYPETSIRVEGHTDSTGNETYNQQLSDRRAAAVKNALTQHNVAAHRIQAIGYGETMPISSNNAQNRRVSIVIIPAAQG
jgi:outer membrane protein OmpA-like peptidoglycan-associated protein